MKRVLIILAILVIAAAGWWGYTTYVNPSGTGSFRTTAAGRPAGATAEAEPQPQDNLENVIWASGKLEPVTWAALSPITGGTIKQINVKEGDWVTAGDVLIELRNDVLESEVERAKAAVAEAQAARDKLLAGATDAEIAAAQAELAAAKAAVALAEGQLQEAQAAITAAEAQLNIAQQEYNELASHPTEAERRAAAAEVDIAQAAVNQAQAAYNRVRGDPNIAARPEALALQQATETLKAAQAKYALATQGATPQQLAVARAQIQAAEAQVSVAKSKLPAAEAAVESAKAREASAQAALDRVLAGPTEEDIAIADAHVRSAIAALTSAIANLRNTQIVAPFDGQVGSVTVRPGEVANPGQVLVLLGDTRHMHVKTTDLRETDVVPLSVGMPVEVTFDALPNHVFQGTIEDIAPVSNTEKGSTNYTVDINVADLDESLRWGMTAFVNIQVNR